MAEAKDLKYINEDNRSFYEKWQEKEGLDVIGGMFVEDLWAVPLKPWKRKGGLGVFIQLEGAGGENSSYVCEIPPGGSLLPQKHMFEEIIFILEGKGSTMIWNESGPKQSFEWQRGSLFSPPLNAWHQHFNAQGDKPVRYWAVTLALPMMNIFHNEDFIFNNSFQFTDRYRGGKDYFSGQGTLYSDANSMQKVWETNFIPDLMKLDLVEWTERGGGGKSLSFQFSENVMTAHMSEFSVGTYKKAHRHGPGAHVIIVSGEGYTLMWAGGDPIQRYDWKVGSMIVPPEAWWHQHFNISKEPAKYLALHGRTSRKYISGEKRWKGHTNVKEGGDQIEYEDEDPTVRETFEKELAKHGVRCKMPEFKK